MSSRVITFEAPEETVRAFDDIAASMSMSREEALQNLMERCLNYDGAFRASVNRGVQQANAGLFIDQTDIEAQVQRWEQKIQPSGKAS